MLDSVVFLAIYTNQSGFALPTYVSNNSILSTIILLPRYPNFRTLRIHVNGRRLIFRISGLSGIVMSVNIGVPDELFVFDPET